MLIVFLVLATCCLAYANGAIAGSMCSLLLAQQLLVRFSANGIVPDEMVGSERLLLAIALGTALTIIIATLAGFPVSTTHGLTGAIIGSSLVAAGAAVNLQPLVNGFLLPLLLSPILAVIVAAAFLLGLRFTARDLPRTPPRVFW